MARGPPPNHNSLREVEAPLPALEAGTGSQVPVLASSLMGTHVTSSLMGTHVASSLMGTHVASSLMETHITMVIEVMELLVEVVEVVVEVVEVVVEVVKVVEVVVVVAILPWLVVVPVHKDMVSV